MAHILHNKCFFLFTLFIICFSITGCSKKAAPALASIEPDFIIFTCQEPAVYEPIIKEYQERTGLAVEVLSGTYQDLQSIIQAGDLAAACDLVFGVDSVTLENNQSCWEPYTSPLAGNLAKEFGPPGNRWTSFSIRPLVIMYNTKVVTYRELPEGWASLLEPRWQGRIAFMNPEESAIYSIALAASAYSFSEPFLFIDNFLNNLNGELSVSFAEVNNTIADGRCFLGVTVEEKAESLRLDGADIDYIYPREGTWALIDGSAIVSGSDKTDLSRDFIDFTISKDVQNFLVDNLKRRSVRIDFDAPAGLSALANLPVYGGDLTELSKRCTVVLVEWRFLQASYEEDKNLTGSKNHDFPVYGERR